MNNMKDKINKLKFIAVVIVLPICITVLAWVVVALIAR